MSHLDVTPLSLADTADLVGIIRDISILVILLVVLLSALVIFFKVSSILGSVKRAIKNAEDITSTISGRVVRPATAGAGVAFGAGKAMAFLFGLIRRGRKS